VLWFHNAARQSVITETTSSVTKKENYPNAKKDLNNNGQGRKVRSIEFPPIAVISPATVKFVGCVNVGVGVAAVCWLKLKREQSKFLGFIFFGLIITYTILLKQQYVF
jgi:hypothetical protein